MTSNKSLRAFNSSFTGLVAFDSALLHCKNRHLGLTLWAKDYTSLGLFSSIAHSSASESKNIKPRETQANLLRVSETALFFVTVSTAMQLRLLPQLCIGVPTEKTLSSRKFRPLSLLGGHWKRHLLNWGWVKCRWWRIRQGRRKIWGILLWSARSRIAAHKKPSIDTDGWGSR